jgi:hypothetical protein
MISPPAPDFQIAARKALANKPAPLDECNRCMIFRLNIGLKPVEFELGECVSYYQSHPFAHQALSLERREGIIPQKCAVKGPANNVVQIDHPNQLLVGTPNDEETEVALGSEPRQVRLKGLVFGRRRDPRSM